MYTADLLCSKIVRLLDIINHFTRKRMKLRAETMSRTATSSEVITRTNERMQPRAEIMRKTATSSEDKNECNQERKRWVKRQPLARLLQERMQSRAETISRRQPLARLLQERMQSRAETMSRTTTSGEHFYKKECNHERKLWVKRPHLARLLDKLL